jgi:hypothetical protein
MEVFIFIDKKLIIENEKKKKTNLGMFPMDKRCHHGSYRKMQRVFEEHFGHVQFVSLYIVFKINIKQKKKSW